MKRIILNGDEVRQVLDTGRVVVRRAAPIRDILFNKHVKSHEGFLTWSVHFSKPLTSRKAISTHGGTFCTKEQARNLIGSQWNPLGKPGDKVWVGETHRATIRGKETDPGWVPQMQFQVDKECFDLPPICTSDWEKMGVDGKWRSSAAMPQWASRLTLEIEAVRVERGDKWEWVYELKRVQE